MPIQRPVASCAIPPLEVYLGCAVPLSAGPPVQARYQPTIRRCRECQVSLPNLYIPNVLRDLLSLLRKLLTPAVGGVGNNKSQLPAFS